MVSGRINSKGIRYFRFDKMLRPHCRTYLTKLTRFDDTLSLSSNGKENNKRKSKKTIDGFISATII